MDITVKWRKWVTVSNSSLPIAMIDAGRAGSYFLLGSTMQSDHFFASCRIVGEAFGVVLFVMMLVTVASNNLL